MLDPPLARVKPTRRGCRAGSKKKRPISVVVTDFRESSRQANEFPTLLVNSNGFHSAEAAICIILRKPP